MICEVYRIKRNGPRMEPRGTPKRMLQILDVLVQTRTECVLPVRNEAIHSSAEAVMPNFNSSLQNLQKDERVDTIESSAEVQEKKSSNDTC